MSWSSLVSSLASDSCRASSSQFNVSEWEGIFRSIIWHLWGKKILDISSSKILMVRSEISHFLMVWWTRPTFSNSMRQFYIIRADWQIALSQRAEFNISINLENQSVGHWEPDYMKSIEDILFPIFSNGCRFCPTRSLDIFVKKYRDGRNDGFYKWPSLAQPSLP